MSIVINLVSPTTSWIMSDGLVTAKTGEKVRGNQRKFEALHPKLYLGYTGHFEFAQRCVHHLRMQRNSDLASFTVEKCADKLCAIAREGNAVTGDNAQFLVTGISDNGKFATLAIQYGSVTARHYPNSKQPMIDIVFCNVTPPEKFGSYLTEINDIHIREAMYQMVQDVADVDPTVNRNVFFDVIRL